MILQYLLTEFFFKKKPFWPTHFRPTQLVAFIIGAPQLNLEFRFDRIISDQRYWLVLKQGPKWTLKFISDRP